MSPTPPSTSVVVGATAGATGGAGPLPELHVSGATAALLSVSAGLVGISSYACSLVMAHLLDASAFTEFAACIALVGTAGVASAALIPLPLAHAVRSGTAVTEATTFAVGVSVVVGLAAGAVLGLLTAGLAPWPVAVAAGVSGFALFVIAPVWGFLQGRARFARYAFLTVLEVLVRLVVSVAVVLSGLGAAAAVGAFAVGALAVLLVSGPAVAGSLSFAALPRVMTDRLRWRETAGVAATQAVLSALAVLDVVVVATVLADAAGVDTAAAAGYQAFAALAKAPVYVAVGTALVTFPTLRASSAADRDRLLRSALTTFARLVVPAAAAVATVPPALVALVLPGEYLGSLTLLGWLVVGGVGVGTTTVVATLLLALGDRWALVLGLAGAALALGAGLGAGIAFGGADPVAGLAHGGAVGAVVGAAAVCLVGASRHPRSRHGLGGAAGRGVVYGAVVVIVLVLARESVAVWLVALAVVGLGVVAIPAFAAQARSVADHGDSSEPMADGLRVLHLAFEDPAMPGSGGGALRTAEIDRRLAEAGHHVTVVTTRFPGALDRTEPSGAGSLRWVHAGLGRGGNRLSRLLGYVACVPFLARSVDADVVVEDFFAPVSSMGVPWFSPRPTVGVVQWLNAREKARQYRVPVHWVERLTVRGHRDLIAMSSGVAKRLARLAPRARTTVIGNGLDPAAFTSPRSGEGRDVLFVGRLEAAQKGLDLLIDAWAQVAPHVEGRLVVAGTGPDEQALRDRVGRLDVTERVHFAGWVAGRDKYELLASSRLAAVPSRFETFGIVAIEALATGTAVVAFDIDCLREVVPTGPVATGVLVTLTGEHDADVAAYAAALLHALTDDAVRAAAAEYGPDLAAVYDWDELARAQEDVLRAVVARSPVVGVRKASRPRASEAERGTPS